MRHAGQFKRRISLLVVAGCLTPAIVAGSAQNPVGGIGSTSSSTHQASGSGNNSNPMTQGLDVPDTSAAFQDSARQKRNEDRQRRLVSDTEKLVTLTNQLKAEVTVSGAESMTPEMLRQMDEIEKLARSVKDKMRN